MSPRKGPRRPLFSARVDEQDVEWVRSRAAREGTPYPDFARRIITFARLTMPKGWTPPEEKNTERWRIVNYEDMTVGELELELDRLEEEKEALRNNWMVDDPDDEWGQVIREIDRVMELLNHRRSV